MQTSTTSISSYLTEIARYPLLDVAKEQKLAHQFRESGDRDAASLLVTSNLRFVVKIALEYRSYGLRIADLVQEGNLGLMKAVEKFEPSRGIRLISYAVWWIRAYIQNFILRSWSLVKIGTTQAQRRLFFSLTRARREIERFDTLDPSTRTERLAERLNVKTSEVTEMEQRMSGRDMSLDLPVEVDGPPRMDLVPGHEDSADDVLAGKQISVILTGRVATAMTRLDERERYIIQKRVLDESPVTFKDLGEHFGVSRERARQLELRAKDKLRRLLKETLAGLSSEEIGVELPLAA